MNIRTMSSTLAAQGVIDCGSLSEKSKENLLLFIKKFSDLEFYKNLEDDISSIEKAQDIIIPEVFKVYRCLLAGVEYGKNARYVFYLNSKTGQILDVNNKVFDVSFFGNGLSGRKEDKSRKTFLYSSKRISLFPIATCEDSPGLYLGINLLGDDKSVYMFNSEDVFDAEYDGEDIFTAVHKVFSDYADLLSSITRVLFEEDGKNISIEAIAIDIHSISKLTIVNQERKQRAKKAY